MSTNDKHIRYIQAIYYQLEKAIADYKSKSIMEDRPNNLFAFKWQTIVEALESFKDDISIQDFMDSMRIENDFKENTDFIMDSMDKLRTRKQ
jgi:tRNA A37 threonylcarbamoyladenosine dehydratase